MQSAVCGAGVYTERQSFSRLYSSIVRIVAQATVYIYIYIYIREGGNERHDHQHTNGPLIIPVVVLLTEEDLFPSASVVSFSPLVFFFFFLTFWLLFCFYWCGPPPPYCCYCCPLAVLSSSALTVMERDENSAAFCFFSPLFLSTDKSQTQKLMCRRPRKVLTCNRIQRQQQQH
jgi:hypothetical protein